MKKGYQETAPGILEFREGGGLLSLFGMPFLAAGIFVTLIGLGIVRPDNAAEIRGWGWAVLVAVGLLFVGAEGGLLLGRSWTRLEQETLRRMLQAKAQRSMCDANLNQLRLALWGYRIDHGGAIPTNFNALASSVSLLVNTRPADVDKRSVETWDAHGPERSLSYRMLPVPKIEPDNSTHTLVIVCPVHGRTVFCDWQVRPYRTPRPGSGKIS